MKAKIITYSVAHESASIRSKLNRELNGYKDISNNRRYKYKRQGILDCILYIKPTRNTIITPVEPAKMVLQALQEHGAKVNIINIQIDKSQFKK